MAELCSFCGKSIFSKASFAVAKRPFDRFWSKLQGLCKKVLSYLVSQEAFFWQMAGVWNFFDNFDPIFHQSSGTREILTTARSLVGNGLPAKTTQLCLFWIFLLQNYIEASSINTLNNKKKSLISLFA